jgi:regulator of protease activity HflC (stomatin/prohibitin superfamily)
MQSCCRLSGIIAVFLLFTLRFLFSSARLVSQGRDLEVFGFSGPLAAIGRLFAGSIRPSMGARVCRFAFVFDIRLLDFYRLLFILRGLLFLIPGPELVETENARISNRNIRMISFLRISQCTDETVASLGDSAAG